MAETCLRIHAQVMGRGNYRVEDHSINVHAMLDNDSELQRFYPLQAFPPC
jgi:hypothetical protein